VDARGSGASFGTWHSPWSPLEVADGAEVIDFAIQQPWSNGKVGATGNSYDGTAAEMLAINHHPALLAVAPRCSLFDVYTDVAYPGGLHLRWFTDTWTQANKALDTNHPHRIAALAILAAHPGAGEMGRKALEWILSRAMRGVRTVDEDPGGELLSRALLEHVGNLDVHQVAESVRFRDDKHESGLGGLETMDGFSPSHYREQLREAKVAWFGITGWLDGAYQHAGIKRHATVVNPGRDKDNGGLLLIGPWNHGCTVNASPRARQRRASFSLGGELLRFFDYHLRGAETGIASEKQVRFFAMGAEEWRSAPYWPPPGYEPMRFYLHEGRKLAPLAPSAPSARLLENAADSDAEDPLTLDLQSGSGPRSRWRSLVSPFVVPDYPDREARTRGLPSYATPPLEEDLEIAGHPLVALWLRARGIDGAIFLYLEEEDKDGRIHYVTEGQLRLVFRDVDVEGDPMYRSTAPYRSFLKSTARRLEADRSVRFLIDLLPTAYVFRRKSRVRLTISGSDLDHFAPVPQAVQGCMVARNARHSSFVELPVLRKSNL